MAELSAVEGPSNLSYKDIAKMPYLDACVKEGMRLTSPFSGPLPRLSPRGGISIDGTYIPEGTVILVMHCQMHMDERIFPEPAKFSPERWLGPQGNELDRFFLGVSSLLVEQAWSSLPNMICSSLSHECIVR